MLALPIFTASSNYRFAVRNSPVDCCRQKKNPLFRAGSKCWRYLFSQPVTRQLSSAQMSLTSVFGMGTGGPSSQSTPTIQFCASRMPHATSGYTLKTEHE